MPVPFMSLALLIFIVFAREETIDYYVRHNQKDKAIHLMKAVLQKQPESESPQDVKDYNDYYERKFKEKKEYGVLYTG